MREIKFRAWDKENCVMHFSRENEDNIVWEIQPKIKFLELRTIDRFPGCQYHEQTEEWVEPEQILMQYTGLKDKNGKEIYEGDIYKSRLNTRFPYTFEVITWSDIQQGWIPKINFGNDTVGRANLGEVVGNVYENPELLKNTS